MVIASHQQHTAVLGCAGMVHVFEHIGTAVDTRAFGVPHGKHAIVFRWAKQRRGLSAPHRGCGQLFIHTRDKFHMVLCQMGLGFPQGFIQSTQGRTSVTTDKPRRVQAHGLIAQALHHRQSNQRLYT